jgi:hypothetical protein
LFDEIAVKQLGDMEGGPFQLQVRKAGKHGASPRRNLIDVGYGVSQALPVLVELFRSNASQMLLFQQPEVHLHPSAQAALGTSEIPSFATLINGRSPAEGAGFTLGKFRRSG